MTNTAITKDKPMYCHTLEEYKKQFPNETRTLQATAVGTCGTHIAYFQGNYDKEMIGAFVCSHSYVNSMAVMICEITVF